MRTVILTACAALFALGFAAQGPEIDNAKLQPLIGDWEGTASLNDSPKTASTVKGAKTLSGNWIKLDLKFTLEEQGPVEAVGYLCSNSDGVVEGHFLASFSPNGLTGKGRVEGKKLTILVQNLSGEESMEFVFDMSVADELKFNVKPTETGSQEHLAGSYKRKK
jgi:hypothetical protein